MTVFFIIIISLFSLLGILIFLVKPAKKTADSFFETKLFAHRGCSAEGAAENSLSAFKAAASLGYGIELDVRLSKDGIPVVFHDRTLSRMCGDKRKLSGLTATEISALKLSDSNDGIPLLREILATLPNTPILCELKTDSLSDLSLCLPVAKLLENHSAPVAVQSFNPFALRKIKKIAPHILRGQLSGKEKNPVAFLLRSQLMNFLSRPHFVSYNINSREAFFLRLCRRIFGLRLLVWTSRDPKCADNADGIIFDC